ncbi:MAG: adenylate kinase [Planctomycetota bacterium]|jgi:adenylate kinase
MSDRNQARAVFLGGPGAGKGTQAKRLSESFVFAHISTGDMLRSQVAKRTDLGNQAKILMDQGKLVSDELIVAMVKDRIAEPDAKGGWILDGFPRTLPQAVALDRLLGASKSLQVTHVVYFRIADGVLELRLSGRRNCAKCGAIWHVANKPTRKDGVCDLCGGVLVHRADDRPEAIQKRLQDFHAITAGPLHTYYKNQGVLREVDANRSQEVIYQELVQLMQ